MVTALRILRVKRDLTIKELSQKVGVNTTWYCRMERGQSYIPPHLRQKLADFFGVQISEICDPKTGWPILIDNQCRSS
ncbi:MAG: helix-turn-helix domain-containing protein [Thermovenabulum sp.]